MPSVNAVSTTGGSGRGRKPAAEMPNERGVELLAPPILIVDDEEPILRLLAEALEAVGHPLDLATRGQEALRAVQETDYAAILLDLDLPDLRGEEVLRQARALRDDTEIIIITGYATTGSAIEALHHGVFDYIRKPFRVQAVVQTVRNALTKRRLKLENRRLLADLQQHEAELQRRVDAATAELRRSNEELGAVSSRIRATLESLGDGVVTVDQDGTIMYVNRAAEQITGYTRAEVEGRPWNVLIDAEAADRLAETLLTGQEFSGLEAFVQRADGRTVPVRLTSSVFRSEDGEVLGAVQAFQDMTREHELERVRSEFLTTVSHELRTPLASVRGYVELLLQSEMDEASWEETRETLEAIARNTDRLVSLTGDILDMAKVQAGTLDVSLEEFDATALLYQVAQDMGAEARVAGIRLDVQAEGRITVCSDSRRLVQAIRELVANAIKHADGATRTTITAQSDDGHLRITVADDGCGIPAEHRPYVFDKFYRADGSLTRKTQGAGLGLALVRAITTRLGGTIELDSSPGQGCVFALTLPLEPPTETRRNA